MALKTQVVDRHLWPVKIKEVLDPMLRKRDDGKLQWIKQPPIDELARKVGCSRTTVQNIILSLYGRPLDAEGTLARNPFEMWRQSEAKRIADLEARIARLEALQGATQQPTPVTMGRLELFPTNGAGAE